MVASLWSGFRVAHGRSCVGVCHVGFGDGSIGDAIRTLLYVAEGPRSKVLFLFACLHGRHAGDSAFREPHTAGGVLGADKSYVVFTNWLLASSYRRPPRCPHGIHSYRDGRVVFVIRCPDSRSHCRQL